MNLLKFIAYSVWFRRYLCGN